MPISVQETAAHDSITFFSREDWDRLEAEENAGNKVDWGQYACFGSLDYEDDTWFVRVADAGGPLERPVLNEDPSFDGYRSFNTQEELIEYMKARGFVCA